MTRQDNRLLPIGLAVRFGAPHCVQGVHALIACTGQALLNSRGPAARRALYLVESCFHHDLGQRLLVPWQHGEAIAQKIQNQRKVLRIPVYEYVPLYCGHKGQDHVHGAGLSGQGPGRCPQHNDKWHMLCKISQTHLCISDCVIIVQAGHAFVEHAARILQGVKIIRRNALSSKVESPILAWWCSEHVGILEQLKIKGFRRTH